MRLRTAFVTGLTGTVSAVLAAVSLAGPAAAATGPANGTTFTVSGVGSGKLLDVSGGSTAENAPVVQLAASGSTSQRWVTRSAAAGYTVVNAKSGKCLTVSGTATAVGAAVVQSTCVSGSTRQSWTFSTSTGGFTVRSVASNLCLDVTGRSTANNAVIEQWTCNGGNNQQWLLTAATTTTSAKHTVVAFGDSITWGYGSTANHTYPQDLARRLAAATSNPKLDVVNAGISGNKILTDSSTNGASALHRFAKDALGQSAVKDVIFLEGINDLRGTQVTGQSIIDADKTLIAQAHAAGVKIYGGTILPCGGRSDWTTTQDAQRGIVNTWIRTSNAFDGVVDFDAAVRDPAVKNKLLHAYDHGDHLHLNDAGYQAMANAVNLSVL